LWKRQRPFKDKQQDDDDDDDDANERVSIAHAQASRTVIQLSCASQLVTA